MLESPIFEEYLRMAASDFYIILIGEIYSAANLKTHEQVKSFL